jgi:hypothetical protein
MFMEKGNKSFNYISSILQCIATGQVGFEAIFYFSSCFSFFSTFSFLWFLISPMDLVSLVFQSGHLYFQGR